MPCFLARPRPTCFFATLLLLGCGMHAKPTSTNVARVRRDVTLTDGPAFPPSRKIGEVEAVDCARSLGEPPVIANAREGLKRQAMKYGGNAVGNIMCEVALGPPHSECWEIARCTGDVECASLSTNPWIHTSCR